MKNKGLKEWATEVTNALASLAEITSRKNPIKVVQYGWWVSPTAAAGTRLLQNASPSNSTTPTEPQGYTFLAWVQFASIGWVGAIYPSGPLNKATDIFTATAKPSTSGVSVIGTALYVRNDLL